MLFVVSILFIYSFLVVVVERKKRRYLIRIGHEVCYVYLNGGIRRSHREQREAMRQREIEGERNRLKMIRELET